MEDAVNDGVKIQHNLSAFLSSCRSIPEHMLEEYNQKYSLGISKKNELNSKTFRAKSFGNKNAQSFIDYFDARIEEIKKDKIGNFMWEKRNLNIHRSTVSPDIVNIHAEMDSILDVSSVGVFDPDTPEEVMNKQLQEENERKLKELSEKRSKTGFKVTFHFNEFPEIDVKNGCKGFLDLMKKFAQDIRNKYQY